MRPSSLPTPNRTNPSSGAVKTREQGTEAPHPFSTRRAADRSVHKISQSKVDRAIAPATNAQTLSYFIITLLGFSFWFFMAVPFASHRETYWWLAMTQTQPFAKAFSVISVTYRPMSQGATWLAFLALNSRVFPTSVLRQTLLQGLVYGMFAFAWWLIYWAAPQRRLLAIVALLAGGVFFPGYVHLFHIYGIMYVPVVLTLGVLLYLHASDAFKKHELWFAVGAVLLVLWHPFATALFVGYYFGIYLETWPQRRKTQHIQAFAILLAGTVAIVALALLFPRADAMMSLQTRLFGFLVSYRTSEINLAASLLALLLTQAVVFSMHLPPKLKMATFLFVSALSGVFLLAGFPLLLLWLCAALIKLACLRRWSLLFLMLTAAVLPFGAGIGAPVFALFAVILAIYATPLGWSRAEESLSFVKTRYVAVVIIATAMVSAMVRIGVNVPIVTKGASPFLAEREKTYQLEDALAWLHKSDYCGYQIGFIDDAGSPIDSLASSMSRQNRPPSSLEDVQLFWNSVLRCQKSERPKNQGEVATVTFGGITLANSEAVFRVPGRYAGEATVWVRDHAQASPRIE
jgi:hypothetical protein